MKRGQKYFLTVLLLIFIPFEVFQQNGNSAIQHDPITIGAIIPFAGYWLNDDYYNCILEFKSPRKANELTGCNFIIIPHNTSENVTMICNFHEETYFTKIVNTKNGFEISWIEQGGISQYQIEIQQISKTQIKIADKHFTKVNPSIDKGFFHSSLEQQYLILEEILFKGKYLTTDNNYVEFKKNGEVLGIDDFQYYSPIIFYFNDGGLQVDQVYLGKSEQDKNIKPYGFKFVEDTLRIYKLNCLEFDSTSNSCGVVEFGELFYTLLKKY